MFAFHTMYEYDSNHCELVNVLTSHTLYETLRPVPYQKHFIQCMNACASDLQVVCGLMLQYSNTSRESS